MSIEMFGWDVVCLGIFDSLVSLRFVVLVGGGASFSIEFVHSLMELLGACSLIIVCWMEGGLLGLVSSCFVCSQKRCGGRMLRILLRFA